MARKIGVLVVDDVGDISRLYCRAIDQQGDMSCVATLSSADRLLDEVGRRLPDVVLLDLNMHGLDPLEATRRVSAAHPECRILVFSGHSDPETAKAAVDAGAWGLVSKIAPPGDIFDAIRRVASGEMVFG